MAYPYPFRQRWQWPHQIAGKINYRRWIFHCQIWPFKQFMQQHVWEHVGFPHPLVHSHNIAMETWKTTNLSRLNRQKSTINHNVTFIYSWVVHIFKSRGHSAGKELREMKEQVKETVGFFRLWERDAKWKVTPFLERQIIINHLQISMNIYKSSKIIHKYL